MLGAVVHIDATYWYHSSRPEVYNSRIFPDNIHSVDLEVWSKLAKRARILRIASKYARDFDCDLQRVNASSHCVSLTRVLLPQIISYSDTKVPVLVVMEYKRASVGYVYELTYLLHTSKSTECS